MSLSVPFLELSNSCFLHHSLINVYFLEGGSIGARWLEGERELFGDVVGFVFPSKINI